MTTEPPSIQRLKLRHAGYDPLPAWGKFPPIEEWEKKFNQTDEEIRFWDKMWPYARPTGVLGRRWLGVDIDLLNPEAAEAIEQLAREHFEERGTILVRIGQAPMLPLPRRCMRRCRLRSIT